MDGTRAVLLVFLVYLVVGEAEGSAILCQEGFCRTYGFDVGCAAPAQECRINNATHTGLWMLSPTTCNCCDFCLPFYGEGHHCSLGGPGLGTTVGRCGDGLTCKTSDEDGENYCTRIESVCHSAQDEYDERHERGEVGALESRPNCDGKGKYGVFDCVPTQTCFCQSEDGGRIFGEVLNLGSATEQHMHCGCSRRHEMIKKNIGQGVPYPVIGPRCTANGNFNPVQCINRVCYCVDTVTGVMVGDSSIDLDNKPITELPCYNRDLDLYPQQSTGEPPYNYTTPCFERMQEMIEFLQQSEEDGFNVDFFSDVPECLLDGTFGRISTNRNASKICVDQNGDQIGDYEALPNTQQYGDMDCKCALTSHLMQSLRERPVCCSNGNFRNIQCRRGFCRCVDSDGRQHGQESADVSTLPCFNTLNPNWQDIESANCYEKW